MMVIGVLVLVVRSVLIAGTHGFLRSMADIAGEV